MIEYLEHIDRAILLWLNSINSPFFDFFFNEITKTRTGIPLYGIIIFYFFKSFPVLKAIQYTVLIILCVALADLSSVHLFKNVFERYRPSHNLEIQDLLHYVNNYRGGRYGFVSSHAANLFSVATFVYLVIPNKAIVITTIIWACLGSYSRIYLGVHYPSDIACGALLGAVIAYSIYIVFIRNSTGSDETIKKMKTG